MIKCDYYKIDMCYFIYCNQRLWFWLSHVLCQNEANWKTAINTYQSSEILIFHYMNKENFTFIKVIRLHIKTGTETQICKSKMQLSVTSHKHYIMVEDASSNSNYPVVSINRKHEALFILNIRMSSKTWIPMYKLSATEN